MQFLLLKDRGLLLPETIIIVTITCWFFNYNCFILFYY